MMLETRFESVGKGKRLRVARLGTGKPLVLLHGYPENLQIWCELAPRLASRCEVIAFDWPGMGESESWSGGTTPKHQAERLRALLDHWGLERASVLGCDMGGQPALVFAARFPERTRSVIVMNSLLFGAEETSWEIRLLREFGWNRLILRNMPSLVFRRAERTFLPRGTHLPESLRAEFWRSFRRAEVREFIVRLCAGYQGTLASLPDLYARIQVPVLALWGGRDRHFPPIHAETLQKVCPLVEVQIVPEGEHWMAWHRAEEIAQRLLAHPGVLPDR